MTVDVMAQLAIGQQFADAAATGPLMIGTLAAAAAGLISFTPPVRRTPGTRLYVVSGQCGRRGGRLRRRGGTVATKRQWAVAGAAGLFILGFTIVFVLATVTGGVPRVVEHQRPCSARCCCARDSLAPLRSTSPRATAALMRANIRPPSVLRSASPFAVTSFNPCSSALSIHSSSCEGCRVRRTKSQEIIASSSPRS